jgi:hypothetical protein
VAVTAYAPVETGAHHRVWQRLVVQTNVDGSLFYSTNSFTELQTGLARPVAKGWADTSDQLQITATGAQSTNAFHGVAFLGTPDVAGALDITQPSGQHLSGHVLGLSYFDLASGKSVLIAEPKSSQGQLLPSGNEVQYPDAFTDFAVDILYQNSRSGLEQLIVLRQQPPSPADWGLDPATTVLQVITEWTNAPSPQITSIMTDAGIDELLDFGSMQMGRGEAFALGAETNRIPVLKQWLILDGRTCLVEQVPFEAILPQLRELPPAPPGSASISPSTNSVLHMVSQNRLMPQRRAASGRRVAMKVATHQPKQRGFALDFTLLSSQTNLTLQSDTTYYVSGTVTVNGSLTIEGGTVVKYTNASAATITATNLVCKTGPYRPALFLAKDDDSAGDQITASSHNPGTNFYGNIALDLSGVSSPSVSNVIFANISNCLAGTSITVSDAQFNRC